MVALVVQESEHANERKTMTTIMKGNDWICINDDRIQVRTITRYQVQVASRELKLYLLSGEIFKVTLDSEAAKNQILGALDEMCGLIPHTA